PDALPISSTRIGGVIVISPDPRSKESRRWGSTAWRGSGSAAENSCDLVAEAPEDTFDRAFDLLLERAAMDGTVRGRHFVVVFEVLGVHGASLNGTQVRDAAQFLAVQTARHAELAGRQDAGRPLHEFRPDRQRDSRAVRVASNRRGLVEADPHHRHDFRGEADEPRVVVIVVRAGLAA